MDTHSCIMGQFENQVKNMYKSDFNKDRSRQKRFESNPRPNMGEQEDKLIVRIQNMANLTDLKIKEISEESGLAHQKAREFKGLNTTQLRKFFAEVKYIEKELKPENSNFDNVKDKIFLLQPQLAYASGRNLIPPGFYKLMSVCLQKIDVENVAEKQKKDNYFRFTKFLEAIVAYHKYVTEVEENRRRRY
jgi:CRISPR-associated protein Csm2